MHCATSKFGQIMVVAKLLVLHLPPLFHVNSGVLLLLFTCQIFPIGLYIIYFGRYWLIKPFIHNFYDHVYTYVSHI